jgi:hypothetical protein
VIAYALMIPIFLFTEEILIGIGLDKECSRQTYTYIIYLQPALFLFGLIQIDMFFLMTFLRSDVAFYTQFYTPFL